MHIGAVIKWPDTLRQGSQRIIISKLVYGILWGTLGLFQLIGHDVCAQTTRGPQSLITIGQAAPDIAFPLLLNAPHSSGTLSEYRGKLVILDFWALSCSACIAHMPYMVQLQREFGDRLQVVYVSADSEATVRRFFERRPERKLPNAIGVFEKWAKRFGIFGLPIYVWVNPNGTIIGITNSRAVNPINIQRILNKEPVDLPLAVGLGEYHRSENTKPFLVDGNGGTANDLWYHSVISGQEPGGLVWVDTGALIVGDRPAWHIRVSNADITKLYRTAFGRGDFPANHVIAEIADTTRLRWDAQHAFGYEIIVPEIKKNRIYKMMQQDLERFFDITGTVEKRRVSGYVLTRHDTRATLSDTTRKLSYDGKMSLAQYLSQYLGSVVDHTGIDGRVSLALTGDEMTDLRMVRAALAAYNVDIQPAEMEVEFLILRDLPRDTSLPLPHPRSSP